MDALDHSFSAPSTKKVKTLFALLFARPTGSPFTASFDE
jgi:hypothetical protein